MEISHIKTNPYQPRLSLDSGQMQELVESIRAHGVLQPLLVRSSNGRYELIAGQRRLQAASVAGLTHVPVVVRECSDREMLELALVENLQREDINPLERARAYQRLKNEFGLDQEAVGAAVGKSRASVANSLRLLTLPSPVQNMLAEGKLSEGHARALISLEDAEDIIRAAQKVSKKGLSVRATESLVKNLARRRMPTFVAPRAPRDPNLEDLQSRLAVQLATKVRINPGKDENARGYLQIEFYGTEDLNRICEAILEAQ
ncbi:MAG: ParB/RepB/Spo0J family partition protein [Armatimonadetes bacterium]|nr:ParB/RepB/Spo0J family partition protein [Armatimonadota bacterium]